MEKSNYQKWKIPLQFLAFLLLFAIVSLLFSVFAQKKDSDPLDNTPSSSHPTFTVVLDAGHGGEDGGAVSESGIYEKDINLKIALLLRDYLEANGVPVVMTRTTDILLYDRNVNYTGHKKALDLAARRQIAENTAQCIFVSIHMNAYPQARYSGLQVWYSPNHPDSKKMADRIQATVSDQLQPENNRHTKPATSSIYLLHHLTVPSILVECGFLSNPKEAADLNNAEYQQKIAFLLGTSLLNSLFEMQSSL